MTPSEVYRRNFTASFWFEKVALAEHIDFLGRHRRARLQPAVVVASTVHA